MKKSFLFLLVGTIVLAIGYPFTKEGSALPTSAVTAFDEYYSDIAFEELQLEGYKKVDPSFWRDRLTYGLKKATIAAKKQGKLNLYASGHDTTTIINYGPGKLREVSVEKVYCEDCYHQTNRILANFSFTDGSGQHYYIHLKLIQKKEYPDLVGVKGEIWNNELKTWEDIDEDIPGSFIQEWISKEYYDLFTKDLNISGGWY